MLEFIHLIKQRYQDIITQLDKKSSQRHKPDIGRQ
jgi:hypothetical protein